MKTLEMWFTNVVIKSKNTVRYVKLNANNPQYNLNGFEITLLIDLPIMVNSFSHEAIHLHNSIITTNTGSYNVDSSLINFSVKGHIGEFQMSLDKQHLHCTHLNSLVKYHLAKAIAQLMNLLLLDLIHHHHY